MKNLKTDWRRFGLSGDWKNLEFCSYYCVSSACDFMYISVCKRICKCKHLSVHTCVLEYFVDVYQCQLTSNIIHSACSASYVEEYEAIIWYHTVIKCWRNFWETTTLLKLWMWKNHFIWRHTGFGLRLKKESN